MLLFNAPYILVLKQQNLQINSVKKTLKSQNLIPRIGSSAYFLILVSEKSLEILDGNIANLKETLKSTRAMYSAGMAESTDVDQMVSNVTMVENSRSSLEGQLNLIIIF